MSDEIASDSVPKHPQQHCPVIRPLLEQLGKTHHAKRGPQGTRSLCSSQSCGIRALGLDRFLALSIWKEMLGARKKTAGLACTQVSPFPLGPGLYLTAKD